MKRIALHWQIIIGLFLGVLFAYVAIILGINTFVLHYIKPFGDIFIKLMKMIAAPLVLFSIINGIGSMKNITQLGSMGIKTLGLYIMTTLFAVCLGLLFVNIIAPGKQIDKSIREEFRVDFELWQKENMNGKKIDNICYLCDDGKSELIDKVKSKKNTNSSQNNANSKIKIAKTTKESKPLDFIVDSIPSNIFASLTKTKMLQIIVFSLLFGIVMNLIQADKVSFVRHFIGGLEAIFVKMVLVIMKGMPFFVFALVAGQIVEVAGSNLDKIGDLLSFLLRYSAVLVIGLATMTFIIYPTLLKLLIKKFSYINFFRNIRDAQLTAFSTASSLATLPVTMECIHKKLGISQQTCSFVLPIGATINMDGTSMYQAIAVISLAQLHLIDLTFDQQLIIISTATLASIGAAAIPSAGLVLLIVILESVGLNPLWIALIFPVDRLLDMCRTVVNITGDATVASIIDRNNKKNEVLNNFNYDK